MRALRIVTERTFDVICAGEALYNVTEDHRFRPGGGSVNAALLLARQGLSVGLATVIADDTIGRALVDKIEKVGIDVEGVTRNHPTSGIIFVAPDGRGARQMPALREDAQGVEVPKTWSSQVMLLSGMSPIVEHAGALCRAARAARRIGSVVVVDVNARWELWKGRDSRATRMVLREADVVWCSAEDMLGLNLDLPSLRDALRPGAILGIRDTRGQVWFTGPFGEVASKPPKEPAADDPWVAAICSELVKSQNTHDGTIWDRVLLRLADP